MLTRTLRPLIEAGFDHHFARHLPGESGPPRQARQVLNACWSDAPPTPVSSPRLLGWSRELAAQLGLAEPEDPQSLAAVLAGNRLLPGMRPIAACYGGHQFGQWAGQLGDGRAIVLGDLLAPDGSRHEIQLKGAGLTPYSRHADGRAVLRSSLREFICSEAMHHLGIPTTRALALVGTGETVVRDMFYDGHPQAEPGAIVTRAAPSFLRFGNFEIFAARDDIERLRLLTDYTLREHFPEFGPPGRDAYIALFEEICRRTAVLMAHWLRVGFVHGVMNTDNLSILGLTIDYGPFGWLDSFDPDFTPNTSDRGGRYAWNQQPGIAQWNLMRLGDALFPLIEEVSPIENGLDIYAGTFARSWSAMSLAKIGLPESDAADEDSVLVRRLFSLLRETEIDPTLFFRGLMAIDPETLPLDGLPAALHDSFYAPQQLPGRWLDQLLQWLRDYAGTLEQRGVTRESRLERMGTANPVIIPRNYLLQEAIVQAENGDPGGIAALLSAVRDPYTPRPALAPFIGRRPEWARRSPGCSALSCSS